MGSMDCIKQNGMTKSKMECQPPPDEHTVEMELNPFYDISVTSRPVSSRNLKCAHKYQFGWRTLPGVTACVNIMQALLLFRE